jgi:hypothetical protein
MRGKFLNGLQKFEMTNFSKRSKFMKIAKQNWTGAVFMAKFFETSQMEALENSEADFQANLRALCVRSTFLAE